jgi:predicted Zn-dependent protease
LTGRDTPRFTARVIRSRAWLPLSLALLLASCATNPVTGKHELSLVSFEREIQIGKEGHQAILAEYGQYDDPRLAAYVDSVGQALARVSHRPSLGWTFTVLDDPVVNAFATSGGYVYITRGILAHLNSEAQLAGVLGHEIGHITARHTAQRMTQQQIAGVGLTLASVLSQEFRRYSEAAQSALGLMLLKYGRDDENQADELGVQYSALAGFDPREIPATYRMLARVGERSGQRLPAFLSTHPDPGDREERTRRLATAAAGGRPSLVVASRGYLQRLDGLVFGRDPRQGYFEGDRYYHPQMAFTLEFPAGWQHQESHTSVTAGAAEHGAAMELKLADAGSLSPASYAHELIRRGRVVDASGATETFEGLPAWVGRLAARTGSGEIITLEAAFVRLAPERMIQIIGRSNQPGDADDQRIVASMRSFRPLTERARLAATPDRVHIVKVATTGSFESVIAAFGRQAVDSTECSILNNVEPGGEVRAGELLKIVQPGRRK